MTDRGLDCSGLVHMAYHRLGRLVPRDAHERESAAEALQEQDVRAGDVVFFARASAPTTSRSGSRRGVSCMPRNRDGVQAVVEEPLENVPREHMLRFARL